MAGAAALACGLSLGLVYCTRGERSAFDLPQFPTPAMSRDSAGIRIVEYAGVPDGRAPFALAADPQYRHGDDPGDYAFRYIHAGALLADGSAVVADAQNIELVALNRDGTTHEVLDRQEEGPGDYNSVSAVYTLGQDSIMVADRSPRPRDPFRRWFGRPPSGYTAREWLWCAGNRLLGLPVAVHRGVFVGV